MDCGYNVNKDLFPSLLAQIMTFPEGGGGVLVKCRGYGVIGVCFSSKIF
jgi:hypothetical protein